MHFSRQAKGPVQRSTIGLIVLGLLFFGTTGCRSSYRPTRRTETTLQEGWPRGNNFFTQVSYAEIRTTLPEVPDAEFVDDDELCETCHQTYATTFAHNVHRGIEAPGGGKSCEACHGPASRHLKTRGQEKGLIFSFKTASPAQASEVCLKCHETNACAAGARFRTSKHANCGVTCIDCHRAHYNVPLGTPATTQPGETARDASGNPIQFTSYQYEGGSNTQPSLRGTSDNLGAIAPGICYRCHGDFQEFQEVAGPHQICGSNGFDCTTCHDPHGALREETRKDLCLQCHIGTPTMAWHSSIHAHNGVGCTDCHNPHPRTCVPRVVNISHTQVKRSKRLMMSVQEPEACYKCHQQIYGLNALPSHHPIKEGKMVCSDCHDPHGQETDNLKEASINLLCYKCHAEKQGPFALEHPPVREDCSICHEPHGTVANNLLKQPATFLCLRCHAGHHASHTFGGSVAPLQLQNNAELGPELYTNCTQCHQQIHGSDRVTQHGEHWLQR